jgi:hypothetical protein
MVDDWVHVGVLVPHDDAAQLLEILREQFGFFDADYCVMQRTFDDAQVNYGPCDVPEPLPKR